MRGCLLLEGLTATQAPQETCDYRENFNIGRRISHFLSGRGEDGGGRAEEGRRRG